MSGIASLPGRLALACAFVAVAALLGGCGDDDSAPTNPPAGAVEDTIRIVSGASQMMSMAYSPNPDTVRTGTTVRWINNDSASHTATNDPGTTEIFHVVIAPGGQGTRKFDNAGAFPYHCEMASHQMSGTLVVIP